MVLDPGGVLAWLIVGLVTGWLAGRVRRGGGYGLVGDLVVGIVGALIGGSLTSLLGLSGTTGLIGGIVGAFGGAVLLLALPRAVTRSRSPA
jgi:uncharacterized membrane protein YeaQ/YmgE (transglycosylase-associated protein family)